MKPVVVTAEVNAPAVDVFSVLADIGNHRAFSYRRVHLVDASQDGHGRMLGVIDVRGPFGISRRIATREVLRESPSLIWGVAASSSGSVAHVCWDLEPVSPEWTRVSLSVRRVSLRRVDQCLLLLGGRRLLSGILGETIQRLGSLVPVVEPSGDGWPLGAASSV